MADKMEKRGTSWNILQTEPSADGAFLPDMTEEEYQEYIRDETHGWKGFYNRVTGRTP